MSPDPTGIFLGDLNDPQSLNLYAYVRNNSPSRTDPSGLCDTFDGTCGGGFGISIGFGWRGGGGGNWDWGGGPSGPLYTPANVGNNPNPSNGMPTSDDPFGGETNDISEWGADTFRQREYGLGGALRRGSDVGGHGDESLVDTKPSTAT